MTPLIVVPGTWAWNSDWYRPWSPLGQYLRDEHEVYFYEGDGRPFRWSTDVNGLQVWRRFGIGSRTGDHRDWQAGGAALSSYIVPPVAPDRALPVNKRNILSHSHGVQPVLYACAEGLKINALIDVAGPVRKDMREVAEAARPNINYWIHVHSDITDRMQWLGELGDGALGIVRPHALADAGGRGLNHRLPQVGHSGVLYDPYWFPRVWPTWVDAMRRI